ncbi:hypothetical protein WOLCODRAFT_105197 [Wolfiporia cocos MD-104 SS10]|uniref:ATP-dependent DNA ligase family profile domain-containing protein n=1 Tax=Wolfiporia cocos (strain MD-104) TaxID=742152 RepID=A0A2H3K5Y6_WOLCO|nr:hypothetical protein WOLCODRAFT_105197 [Wolfiporia cocos MD-104 SS10]
MHSFASLIHAVAAIRPRKTNEKKTTGTRSESHAIKTLRNWVTELCRRHSPLPADMVAMVFRLLFPEEDIKRKYNMQETRLARYLVDILTVSTAQGTPGSKLLNWKEEESLGCLGTEVEAIMKGKGMNPNREISITEVDALLTELAAKSAFSASSIRQTHLRTPRAASPRSTSEILRSLYTALSPAEASIVTQIILKDLRPILYPIARDQTHYRIALLHYNSNALVQLTKFDAMFAWDQSGDFYKAFRVRAQLDEAALAFAAASASGETETMLKPQVGVPIMIPKCIKGQSCAQALHQLRASRKVWVETKYDGERAQIHVELVRGKPRITIYSKSGRESTLDRAAIHPVICEGLAIGTSGCKIRKNTVVEAEIVAFSDKLDRIDEFWRIKSLISSTAIGPRRAKLRKSAREHSSNCDDVSSQCSLESDASCEGTRHLAVVFFDVLILDNKSLLSATYAERRKILESIITLRHGYTMVAERKAVPLTSSWPSEAEKARFRVVFAQLLADHQEGVVLKADESVYNDGRLRWVKLKKDYIAGYGDALDLVLIGAAWDKNRGRELRGTFAPTVYTTFYIGALSNSDAIKLDSKCVPKFEVFFTSSYGLSREQLEELNFLIKSSDTVKYEAGKPQLGLSYSCNIFPGLADPAVLLKQPILAEVMGACFDKAEHSKFYELRFPRITKVHRPSERTWTEATTLQEFQRIARESVGHESSDREIDDWCAQVWNRPIDPGARCPEKRKQQEAMWVEQMELADRKLRRKQGETGPQDRDSECEWSTPVVIKRKIDVDESLEESGASMARPTKRIRPLKTVTNLVGPAVEDKTSHEKVPLKPSGQRAPPVVIVTPPSSPLSQSVPLMDIQPQKAQDSSQPAHPEIAQSKYMLSTMQKVNGKPDSGDRTAPLQQKNYYSSPLGMFLHDAIVWLPRTQVASRPSWRVPSSQIVPTGHQVHGLESFLQACNWTETHDHARGCDWIKRGVVFIDDIGAGKEWLDFPVKMLIDRRSSLLHRDEHTTFTPIWIFSIKLLGYEELSKRTASIESQALFRLG